MKSFLILLSLFISTQSFGSCREILEQERAHLRKERDTSVRTYSYMGAAAGATMMIINPAIGGSLFVIFGSDLAYDTIRLNKRDNLIAAIDEAYAYQEKGLVGKTLKRVLRKVKRQSSSDVNLEEVAEGIILANENGDLCSEGRRNIGKFSKVVSVNLDK